MGILDDPAPPEREDLPELNIIDVLLYYGVTVTNTGPGWHTIRCPFHDDDTASAGYNADLNGFRCHACRMSGDAIKIIERRENLGFEAACEFARSVVGKSVTGIPRSTKKSEKSKRLGRNRWKEILE